MKLQQVETIKELTAAQLLEEQELDQNKFWVVVDKQVLDPQTTIPANTKVKIVPKIAGGY